MRELSLNVLDIAQNSLSAGASLICIKTEINTQRNLMCITIEDNGKGMSKEFLSKVCDPFVTTRTTRKVGLGLPFFKMAAEMAGGEFKIDSEVAIGTKISASFKLDSIDRMPLGDMADTIITLIIAKPKADFVYHHILNEKRFEFDTREVKNILGDVAIDNFEVISNLKGFICENINELNKDFPV